MRLPCSFKHDPVAIVLPVCKPWKNQLAGPAHRPLGAACFRLSAVEVGWRPLSQNQNYALPAAVRSLTFCGGNWIKVLQSDYYMSLFLISILTSLSSYTKKRRILDMAQATKRAPSWESAQQTPQDPWKRLAARPHVLPAWNPPYWDV